MPMMTAGRPMRWKMGKSWSRVARAVRIRDLDHQVLSALFPDRRCPQPDGCNDADYGGDHVLESQRRSCCPGCGMPRHWKTASLLVVSGHSFQSPHKNF